MSEVDLIDETLAQLHGRLTRGGIRYGEAFTIEYLVSIFDGLRAQAIRDLEIDRGVYPFISASRPTPSMLRRLLPRSHEPTATGPAASCDAASGRWWAGLKHGTSVSDALLEASHSR